MFTIDEFVAELETASLTTIVIYDSAGQESYRSEFRGNGIKHIIEMIRLCKCDEHAIPNRRSGEPEADPAGGLDVSNKEQSVADRSRV